MHTKHLFHLVVTAGALALLAGCASEPAASTPQDTTKYTVENTEKFAALDKATQEAVSCTGLQERTLPDGRIEVVANLKNREAHPFKVQVNCVFRDDQGFAIGDEPAFQTYALPGKATEVVRFTAPTATAKTYTIHARQTR
jgi:uncharacterized protein YcfL